MDHSPYNRMDVEQCIDILTACEAKDLKQCNIDVAVSILQGMIARAEALGDYES